MPLSRSASVRALIGLLPILSVALIASPAQAGPITTHRFDIFDNGLGIFGVQFSVDFATPVEQVRNTRVVETRMHLEFNTEHSFGNLADAADIAIDFQAPIEHIDRIWTVSGASLGWSGAGTFMADPTTDFLNDPLLDFSTLPDGSLVLWFMRIYSRDEANPSLGGVFSNSYIEVDLAPIPEPATLLLCTFGLLVARRR